MVEYIDAGKIYEVLNRVMDNYEGLECVHFVHSFIPHTEGNCVSNVLEYVKEEVDDIPAADVRPERHGSWWHDGEGHAICTCCNGASDEPYAIYYNFCPNCGAKMDGKDGDNR